MRIDTRVAFPLTSQPLPHISRFIHTDTITWRNDIAYLMPAASTLHVCPRITSTCMTYRTCFFRMPYRLLRCGAVALGLSVLGLLCVLHVTYLSQSSSASVVVTSHDDRNVPPPKRQRHVPNVIRGGGKKFSGVWDVKDTIGQFTSLPTCTNNVTLLILITSAPDNFEKRQAIRQTWCSKHQTTNNEQGNHDNNRPSYQCVFLIGESPSPVLDLTSEREIETHRDVLRGSYVDTYQNLTFKVLSGFYWSSTRCPATYVIKTDDDCFVNRDLVLPYLLKYHQHDKELYVGNLFVTDEDTLVLRDRQSKWFVSEQQYPENHYPSYASGTGYLLSGDMLDNLLEVTPFLAPFPNEDAYVGVLISHLGVQPVHSFRFVLHNSGWQMCNFYYLFVVHRVTPEQQRELFSLAREAGTKCVGQKYIAGWS